MKYRKKPVEVEAFQLTPYAHRNHNGWPEWMTAAWRKPAGSVGAIFPARAAKPSEDLLIGTLEGQLHIAHDDWIIQGVAGEIYPCKPDIFMRTYEVVG